MTFFLVFHFLRIHHQTIWKLKDCELLIPQLLNPLIPKPRNMKSIVGFGALNLDLIFEVDDLRAISSDKVRLEPGKELFGSDSEFQSLLGLLNRHGTLKSKSGGGSGANTIVALARMGFSTKFIGKVGRDEEGDFLLENLKPVQKGLVCRGERRGGCLVVFGRHQARFLFVQVCENTERT